LAAHSAALTSSLEAGLHRPAAGAQLLGRVGDHINERPAGRGVDVGEDLGGDLDQERVEVTGVPLPQHLGDRGRPQPGAVGPM
jgi:hypothetical protein